MQAQYEYNIPLHRPGTICSNRYPTVLLTIWGYDIVMAHRHYVVVVKHNIITHMSNPPTHPDVRPNGVKHGGARGS